MSTNDLYAPDKVIVMEAADGRWRDIFGSLCPELVNAQSRPGKEFECPGCSGKRFRIFKKTAGETSGGMCQSCGYKADGFALIQWVNRWGFHETLQQVGSLLGVEDPHGRKGIGSVPARSIPKTQVNDPGPSNKWTINWLNNTWSQCIALTDPQAEPARLYLRSRGILVWDRPGLARAIRFHPALPYQHENGKKEVAPAIVAAITGADGKGVTLHRIYLTPKGEKAFGSETKKMFAIPSDRTLVGACIQTSPAGEEVNICEGLETALAVETGMERPVWPMVNAYLLEHFQPAPGTKLVVVWADKDRSKAGQDAADALAFRLQEQGIEVRIELPWGAIPMNAKGIDWNDMLMLHGSNAFRNRYTQLLTA